MKMYGKLLLLAAIPLAFYFYSSITNIIRDYQEQQVVQGMAASEGEIAATSALLDCIQKERVQSVFAQKRAEEKDKLAQERKKTDAAVAKSPAAAELKEKLAALRTEVDQSAAYNQICEGYAALADGALAGYAKAANAPTSKGVGKVFVSLAIFEVAKENASRLQCWLLGVFAADKAIDAPLRQAIIKARENIDAALNSPALVLSPAVREKLKALRVTTEWEDAQKAYHTVLDKAFAGKYGVSDAACFVYTNKQMADLRGLIAEEIVATDATIARLIQQTRRAIWFDGSIFAASVLLALLFTWLLARNILRSVLAAAELAEAASAGDFSRKIARVSHDETGRLVRALNKMGDNLSAQVALANAIAAGDLSREPELASERDSLGLALRDMVRGLRAIVSEMQSSGEQVKSSALQISDSAQALSQGATESAASLEEITSSIAEIGSQGKHNADNARESSEIASISRDAAEKGSQRMAGMIGAMGEINASSQQISKIIKTIDDIAFQTNLLALNAAVEAARAGQHGKGFAVVAQEVRNLAARSARAAKETADLIESSLTKVGNGMQIADQTAKVFAEIVESIKKVASLGGEIAHASNEQATGVSQVSQGLDQLNIVIQQNTATSEETASAAQDLFSQSRHLQGVLQRFHLGDVRAQEAFVAAPAQSGGRRLAAPVPSPRRALSAPAGSDVQAGDLIKWSADYSVGVGAMDEQHMVLIRIINKLYAALKAGKATQIQGEIVSELLEFTKTHFGNEERLLRAVNYPGLEQQLKLHRGFEEKIADFGRRLGQSNSLGVEAIQFLKDWLIGHIQKVDKQYENYLGGQGVQSGQGGAQAAAQPKEEGVLIKWSDRLSVGVQAMDAQHQKLIDLINKLYVALKAGKADSALGEILRELGDYTKNHFAKEESLMRMADYAGLELQEKMHRSFEQKVAEFGERLGSGKSLGVEAMQFLKDWLVNHIQKIDKQYEAYIGDNRSAHTGGAGGGLW